MAGECAIARNHGRAVSVHFQRIAQPKGLSLLVANIMLASNSYSAETGEVPMTAPATARLPDRPRAPGFVTSHGLNSILANFKRMKVSIWFSVPSGTHVKGLFGVGCLEAWRRGLGAVHSSGPKLPPATGD